MPHTLLPTPVERDISSLDDFFQHMRQVSHLVVAQLPHTSREWFWYYETSFQEIIPKELNQHKFGKKTTWVTEQDILETARRIRSIWSRI